MVKEIIRSNRLLPSFIIFGIELNTYPTAAVLSAAVGFVLCWLFIKNKGFSFYVYIKIWLGIILGFLIGARILNILLNLQYYKINPPAVYAFKLTGFSIYGGLIGAFLTSLLLLKLHKKNIYQFYDSITMPFLFSFVIMKCGCFLNGCCAGRPTDSFLGVTFPIKNTSNITQIFSLLKTLINMPRKVYPTQLFEAGLILIFIPIAFIIYKSKKYYDGKLFAITTIYICIARLSIHFFRDFPYSETVVNFIYPAFYIAIIIVAVYWLYKHSELKQ